MKWIVAVLGLLLASAGAVTIQQNLGIIQVERGWSSVISGSVVMTGGFIVLAIAVVVARLETVAAVLARRPQAWPAHRLETEAEAGEETEDMPPPRETGFRSVLRQGRELGLGAAAVPPPPREIAVEPLPIQTATVSPDADDDAAYERFAPRFGPVTASGPDETASATPPQSEVLPPSTLPDVEEEQPAKAEEAPAASSLRGFRFHFPPLADPPERTQADTREPQFDGSDGAGPLRGAIDPQDERSDYSAPYAGQAGDGQREWEQDERRGQEQDERRDGQPVAAADDAGHDWPAQDPTDIEFQTAIHAEAEAGQEQTAEDQGRSDDLARADTTRMWERERIDEAGSDDRDAAPAQRPAASGEDDEQAAKPRRRPSLFPLRWQRPSAAESDFAPREITDERQEDAGFANPPAAAAADDESGGGNLVRPAFGKSGEADPEPEASPEREQKSAPPRNVTLPARVPVQDTDWLERALSGVDEPAPSRNFAPKGLPRATFPLPVAAETPPPRAPEPEPEPQPAPPPGPDILGRYEAQGTSYVMYSDGSIEAETSTGTFRFTSLTELKRFIEQRA